MRRMAREPADVDAVVTGPSAAAEVAVGAWMGSAKKKG
jgi:hypothetical protein